MGTAAGNEMPREEATELMEQDQCFPADVSWLRYLPETSVDEFLAEFERLTRAKDWLGLSQMLAEWQGIAEIRSDPDLYAALTSEKTSADSDTVSRP